MSVSDENQNVLDAEIESATASVSDDKGYSRDSSDYLNVLAGKSAKIPRSVVMSAHSAWFHVTMLDGQN